MRRNSPAVRIIAAQIRSLSDSEIYALTFASGYVREAAMQEAHRRAEAFALSADNL